MQISYRVFSNEKDDEHMLEMKHAYHSLQMSRHDETVAL